MGSHIVVLSNTGVAAELLERRSRIYSDKVCEPFGISSISPVFTSTQHQPPMPMVKELWVLSCSPPTTPTINDGFQNGVRTLVLPCDAVR